MVILAILAAILVPTLLGYINKARDEKDYATAQTVRVAAQAAVDQAYGKDNTVADTFTAEMAAQALTLAGSTTVTAGKAVAAGEGTPATTDLQNTKTTLDGKTVFINSCTLGDGTATTKNVAKYEIYQISVSIDGKLYNYDAETNKWSV